jgi:gas vesicle protein
VVYHHVITPNNWAGLAAAIGCVIGAYLWVVLLFAWDLPEKTRDDRYRDILRTHLDMFKESEEK